MEDSSHRLRVLIARLFSIHNERRKLIDLRKLPSEYNGNNARCEVPLKVVAQKPQKRKLLAFSANIMRPSEQSSSVIYHVRCLVRCFAACRRRRCRCVSVSESTTGPFD